jgi:hypothetical protein
MSRKKISQTNQKKKPIHRGNPIPWRYCVLTLICGLFLITGFFFAAGQHFSSIEYSIKNSKLRKQLDELEADKRRLVLAKEIALSPAEIKKVAKKIGFTETTEKIAAVPASINSATKPTVEKIKQSVSNRIETIKKPVETVVKAPVKNSKPQDTKDRPDKPQTQTAAR